MSGVYSVENLLKLRASPLICKPPSLPPIEEWMGSQESATKRPATRGRQDDSNLQTDGFQKRPTLDPSMRKSTTDPERIVLGPPRRSFASSNARNSGKAGATDTQETQKDGVSRHERTKTGEDLEHKLSDRRSGQFGGSNNGKYSNRHEQDHDRPRRRFDEEESEGRPRREHDRPRWGREDKGIEEVDENGNAKLGLRRDANARSRFEQSWLRNDRGNDETKRDGDRSGWRRDRVKDGDWDTPARGDVDPEWMDEPVSAESAQARTQEDFQRWKERMKAAANGPAEEKANPPATIVASKVDGTISSPGITSPDMDVDSMDKFFAKFTEKRSVTDEKAPAAKPVAKSKFMALFGPTATELKAAQSPPPAVPPPPPPTVEPAAILKPQPTPVEPGVPGPDADQAGFQRILEMLGKRNATPGSEPSQKPKLFSNDSHTHERQQSPDLMSLFTKSQPARQTSTTQPPPGLELVHDLRSPAEGHRRQDTPNKDELLLNLLRQADISAKPIPPPQREYNESRPPPALLASMNEPTRHEPRQMPDEHPDMDRQLPMQSRGNGRSIFDDPAISGLSYQDEMGGRQGLQRRPTNNYEDPYFDRMRQQEQKPMQPPPGMPRPPGLDQMSRPPPGWPGQPHLQHPPQRPGPPPGINMPRGMQPPYAGPQQGPMPAMAQQGPRPPQRKYTEDSSLPNFPPGIGPPPGFMSNGPPPGFHHGNPANPNPNYGRYAMAGDSQGPPPQGPPNMGRAFMEMYGNVERGGVRNPNGGVQLPPGFR